MMLGLGPNAVLGYALDTKSTQDECLKEFDFSITDATHARRRGISRNGKLMMGEAAATAGLVLTRQRRRRDHPDHKWEV